MLSMFSRFGCSLGLIWVYFFHGGDFKQTLLLSGSSHLQASFPAVLSVWDDRPVNGNVRGSPTPGRNRMKERLLFKSDLLVLSAWAAGCCWNEQNWPAFRQKKNHGGRCVIHLSRAADPPDAKQKGNLCYIKRGSFCFHIHDISLSLQSLIMSHQTPSKAQQFSLCFNM